ncbi:hypothetical protein BHYA_0043g00450 [Botrytis hyacinthi]|uniref:Uncharacterized protein n=1 Tax=Botrytis hyacinthi TaxID=278943 RepID=A0A4Z1GWI5_9HELO|nr:hypothetical protein BHYA_0043g00450 [Botrytis hyacinthi]
MGRSKYAQMEVVIKTGSAAFFELHFGSWWRMAYVSSPGSFGGIAVPSPLEGQNADPYKY